MKGAIKPNHIPTSNFDLIVAGFIPLTITRMDGIEEELETVDLPDRTVASGGHTKPVEFMIAIPMHHRVEQAAMEAWYRQSKDPVDAAYKKAATLLHRPIGGKWNARIPDWQY